MDWNVTSFFEKVKYLLMFFSVALKPSVFVFEKIKKNLHRVYEYINQKIIIK